MSLARRKNNPQVGLANENTDPGQPQTNWRYDPHIDPALAFDTAKGELISGRKSKIVMWSPDMDYKVMHARGLIAAYPLSNPLIGGFARRFVLHGYPYDLIYSAERRSKPQHTAQCAALIDALRHIATPRLSGCGNLSLVRRSSWGKEWCIAACRIRLINTSFDS